MTSRPINLNKARKAAARTKRKTLADQNSVKFGRTRGEKDQSTDKLARFDRHLDGHKRDDT